MSTKNLLDNIATTTVTAIAIRDIKTYLANLGTGILGAHWATHTAHNLEIGDIVAHVHNLGIGKTVLAEEIIVSGYLNGATKKDILNTKALVANTQAIDTGSRKDGNAEAKLHGKLDGVTVFDINGAQRGAIGTEIDGLGTENSVDIEDNGLYLC